MQNRYQQIVTRLKTRPTQTQQALAQLDRFASALYATVEDALFALILDDVPGIDLPIQEQAGDGPARLHFQWGDWGVALVPCKHVVFPDLDRAPDLSANGHAGCPVAAKMLALAYPLDQPDRRQVLSRYYVFPDGTWQAAGSRQALPLDAEALEAGILPLFQHLTGQATYAQPAPAA